MKDETQELMENYPVHPLKTVDANIKRCMVEMGKAKAYAEREGMEKAERRRLAKMAYRLAMPPMADKEAIHSYIACIAHGIQVGVFDGRDASQLLYAAQVALSLMREEKGRAPVGKRTARKGRA